MSIYIYSKLLRKKFDDITKYNLPNEDCNSIVASLTGNKKPHIMKLEDYDEDRLIKLVKTTKKNLYIDYRFWNYKYCSPEHLKIENLKYLFPTKYPYIDSNLFYPGLVTVMIMYYQILYYTFTIKSDELFKTYLSEINIDRYDFSVRFMTNHKIYLPITVKYILLLTRIFDDNTISDYLFPSDMEPFYNISDTRTVLDFFKIDDIRKYTHLIFSNCHTSITNKLLYINLIFELFDGQIDYYPNVFTTETESLKPVGWYLKNIEKDITDDLYNLYVNVIENYILLDGAENIEMI